MFMSNVSCVYYMDSDEVEKWVVRSNFEIILPMCKFGFLRYKLYMLQVSIHIKYTYIIVILFLHSALWSRSFLHLLHASFHVLFL